jgi:hypothetical protein
MVVVVVEGVVVSTEGMRGSVGGTFEDGHI